MDEKATHQDRHPGPAFPEFRTPEGMGREEFWAMGTTISLLLPENRLKVGTSAVRSLFSEWEQVLSRFLPESELSRLNAQAGEPVAVSDLLYTVLLRAVAAAQATSGVYDPTLLGQIVGLGYDRTFDALPASLPDTRIRIEPGGGWRGIYLDSAKRIVKLSTGVGLDFGGIAKGMAVDAALERLQGKGIDTALVNAGGDLAVIGLPPGEGQWSITVPGKDTFWSMPLRRGAMATSGIARRHWQQGKQQRHHLLDPRTGEPAQTDLWSVTVVADRCEQVEVAAKVAFILGSKDGKAFLQDHQLAGLLVHVDGTWEATDAWPVQLMVVQR
ncbi:MAG TPA: FAD:protein FMN transferase [Ktedonobacteraceae bacterium]|jgi:thiamine biosynthesis lipoprotein|nr:FAD:protein FMN transferase [Ktedonobacteraceae bacterium]